MIYLTALILTITIVLIFAAARTTPEEMYDNLVTGESYFGDGYTRTVIRTASYIAIGEVILVALPILLYHYLVSSVSIIGFVTLLIYVCWNIYDIADSFNRANFSEEDLDGWYRKEAEDYIENPRGHKVQLILKTIINASIRLILLIETILIIL